MEVRYVPQRVHCVNGRNTNSSSVVQVNMMCSERRRHGSSNLMAFFWQVYVLLFVCAICAVRAQYNGEYT